MDTPASETEDEHEYIEKYLAGAEQLKAAALAGETSTEPHTWLLLELIRARKLWAEQPRDTLIGYLAAFSRFLECFDEHPDLPDLLDLQLPLTLSMGALEDLKKGNVPAWLKADPKEDPSNPDNNPRNDDNSRNTRGAMIAQTLVAAAVERYVACGQDPIIAYVDIAQALRGIGPIGRAKQITDTTVREWYKRFKRKKTTKNAASSQERAVMAELLKMFEGIPPAEVPALVANKIKGRLAGRPVTRRE